MSDINIPGYEITEALAGGGTYQVFKAFQTALERHVVIKVLPFSRNSHPDAAQTFMAETQAAARLEHGFIAPIIDANSTESFCYIITEFVNGYSVADWLEKDGVIPEPESLVVAEYVAAAMEYIRSESGLNHGDIKLSNVMLDNEGSIRIANVGLSRSRQYIHTTAPDSFADDSYMTPQQLEGNMEPSVQSDIFQLGAMLYQMVTGNHPYSGIESEEDHVPDPLDVSENVSQHLAWLLEKMLARDPADRHSSWAELKADIKRVEKKKKLSSGILSAGLSMMARSADRKAMKSTGGKKVVAGGKVSAGKKPGRIRPRTLSGARKRRTARAKSGSGGGLTAVITIIILVIVIIIIAIMTK